MSWHLQVVEVLACRCRCCDVGIRQRNAVARRQRHHQVWLQSAFYVHVELCFGQALDEGRQAGVLETRLFQRRRWSRGAAAVGAARAARRWLSAGRLDEHLHVPRERSQRSKPMLLLLLLLRLLALADCGRSARVRALLAALLAPSHVHAAGPQHRNHFLINADNMRGENA